MDRLGSKADGVLSLLKMRGGLRVENEPVNPGYIMLKTIQPKEASSFTLAISSRLETGLAIHHIVY